MAPKASYIRSCEKKNKMIFTVGLLPPPGRGISIQNDRGKALPAAASQQLYPAYRKARAEMQAYPVAQKAAAVLLEREKEQEVVVYLLSHDLVFLFENGMALPLDMGENRFPYLGMSFSLAKSSYSLILSI